MAVLTDINKAGPYTGDGISSQFLVNFPFLDEAHLKVICIANEKRRILKLTQDYCVRKVGEQEAYIHLKKPLPVGTILFIKRNIPLTQLAMYAQGDTFDAQSHEMAFDKLTMINQQLKEGVDRTVKVSHEDEQGFEIPSIEDRRNNLLGFDQKALPQSVSISNGFVRREDCLYINPNTAITANEDGVSVLYGDGLGVFNNAIVVKAGEGLDFDEQSRMKIQDDLIHMVGQSDHTLFDLEGLIRHLSKRIDELELTGGAQVAIYIGHGLRYDQRGHLSVRPSAGIKVDANGVSLRLGEGLTIGNDGELKINSELLYLIANKASQDDVRALWGSINQLNTQKADVSQVQAVIGALNTKAPLSELNHLKSELNTKATQTDVQNIIGALNNKASYADLNALITDHQLVSAADIEHILHNRYANIFPQESQWAQAGIIKRNTEYWLINPFLGREIAIEAQLYLDGSWHTAHWHYDSIYKRSSGVKAFLGPYDCIRLQTGTYSLLAKEGEGANEWPALGKNATHMCRVKVWRVD